MEKQSGVYSITNKENGKRYIGQTVNLHKRKLTHFWALRENRHPNCYLQRAYNEGAEFVFEVLELCAPTFLNEREVYWIAHFNSMRAGYNLCEGGASVLGRELSLESKQKISLANKGRVFSQDIIDRRRRTLREHLKDPEFAASYYEKMRNRPTYERTGQPMSEAQKKRISETLKGRVITQEHREKLRALYSGEKSLTAKLTASDVVNIRLRFLSGEKRLEIAKDYPQVSPQTIQDVIKGRRWKSVPNTIEELRHYGK